MENNNPKKIAVVILNWNGKSLLEKFLPSVLAHSAEAKIYVADNASTDDSITFLNENYQSVTCIQNKENFGYAGGYNHALKQVNELYLILLNSDVEVTKDWLKPILSVFENDDDVAIIQPKILDYYNRDKFEYAGAAGGFIDQYGYPFCRGRIFDTIETDSGQYDDLISVFWASGACFGIRRNIFEALGGFDADFFAHQEEIDLCWRAFNQNYKTVFCGHSTVFHVGGGTLKQESAHKTYLNFRNNLLMLLKNLPQKSLFRIIFIRMILDGLAAFRFVSKGKFSHFWAILKAHFSFYKHIKKTYKKRPKSLKPNYFYQKSIVSQYFLNNNKLFKTNHKFAPYNLKNN
uniref:glycosyltransferase family 2 protein n=2 Tax=Flavobacterium sp. TaxID=239 RepID=UPI00404A7692